MPDLSNKKIVYIDLNSQEYEVKILPDLNKFIGGLGLALKLLHQNIKENPLVFAPGPLNGFFPFCSKTAVVFDDNGVTEDVYFGGRLASRLRFAGIDALVINGKSPIPINIDINNTEVSFKPLEVDPHSLGLPGKKVTIVKTPIDVYVDDYFYTPEKMIHNGFEKRNINAIVVTGTEIYKPKEFSKYEDLYHKILNRINDVNINKSNNPSCGNCPLGCDRSKFGEIGGNVLLHSLVACQYAEKIYADVGIVFSCLNVLGYDYSHEDIEALPHLIEKTLRELA